MKLCFLADASSMHTYRWVKYFAKKHDVYLISNQPKEVAFSNLDLKNGLKSLNDEYSIINVKLILTKINLFNVFYLRKLIRNINPDIVHSHYLNPFGYIGALLNFHPFVITGWGSDVLISPKESMIFKILTKYTIKKADLITADSKNIIDNIIELGGNPKICNVIQWGVDTNIFNPLIDSSQIKNELKIGNSSVVISTRHFKPIYNIDIIIKSIPYVIHTFPNNIFILKTGFKDIDLKYSELIEKLNIQKSIRIVSQIEYEEMPNYLKCADIFVSVPSSDSTSISLLEAMSCSLPVIVSDIPANREWIKDGWNGYIVPVQDPEALAGAIIKLLENKEQRELFGKRNQEIIIERADHEKHMLRMEELYESLLLKHKKW